MRFRNVSAEELDGSAEIPGLRDWLSTVGATDATILITAPPGTGKAAAVGRLARRLGRNVLLCNLMELFDYDEPEHQLENLLRLCSSQRESVIYLDKLDKALKQWAGHHGRGDTFTTAIENWLRDAKPRLLEDQCTVVFTGRELDAIPAQLQAGFDKKLSA